MLKQKVLDALSRAFKGDSFTLLIPKNPDHGDYAIHTKHEKIPTSKIIQKLTKNGLFDKVEEKGGFINFFIGHRTLVEEMNKTLKQDSKKYALLDNLKKKRIIVEFAHPNTHKLFHIGHLRNIALGESISQLFKMCQAEVIRANYQGDVGLHIAKCLYAVKKQSGKVKNLKTLDDKIAFLSKAYAEGNTAYEQDESVKEEVNRINKMIYEKHKDILPLWKETRQWSLDYFDRIYNRVGTKFDRLFFESEVADRGHKIAQEALKKGILTKNEGAVILDGEKHGVDTRVFINSVGIPTYEGKDLGLAELEFSEFGHIDKCIHVVGPEQKSFFRTLFKTLELIDTEKYKGKQEHFAYGLVDLKRGKMSSRRGNVIGGDWLLDEVKKAVKGAFSCDDKTADVIAVGAVKYAFLKVDARKNIAFDIKESISLLGNSGPYLQYTYARCQSVIARSKTTKQSQPHEIATSRRFVGTRDDISGEELLLLRSFFRFPEVIDDAAKKYAPHLICTYLYDLAQKFNLFYEKCPILKAKDGQRDFRLALTRATSHILKNGLHLLGIDVLERI